MIKPLVVAMMLLLTLGCSNTKYCEREQSFHGAVEAPPLRAPEGLQVPEPDPSFIVPEVSVQAQAASLSSDRPCLEIPPTLSGSPENNGES